MASESSSGIQNVKGILTEFYLELSWYISIYKN